MSSKDQVSHRLSTAKPYSLDSASGISNVSTGMAPSVRPSPSISEACSTPWATRLKACTFTPTCPVYHLGVDRQDGPLLPVNADHLIQAGTAQGVRIIGGRGADVIVPPCAGWPDHPPSVALHPRTLAPIDERFANIA